MIKRIIFILTVFLSLSGLKAQVQFNCSAPAQVQSGQTFRVVFTINADARNFRGPSFEGLSVLSGPNQSTNSSIQIINGKVSKNMELSYTYYVRADQVGTFTVGAAEARVDDETLKSNTATIKVVKGRTQQSSQTSGNRGNQNSGSRTTNSSSGEVTADDVFLKAYVSDRNPMQGEQIIVTYKIFTRVPLANFSVNNASTFPGFWTQNLLDEKQRLQQKQEYIDGEEYVTAELKRIALFPMKSGEITIEPMDVDVVAQIQRQTRRRSTGDPFFDSFFNDSFFNNSYDNVKKNLKSNALKINVKAFPMENKPVGFDGAVGSFRFSSSVDKQKLKTNEALNLRYTISGRGNVQLAELPEINFPPDFEVYDPKVNNSVNTTANGVSGTKTFEYLIIPRSAGSFEIPAVTFSFYDPAKNQYVSQKSNAYIIEVEKGADNGGAMSYTSAGREDIKYLGSDIRHLKMPPLELKHKGKWLFGTNLYTLALAGMPLLLILLIVIVRSTRQKRSNEALMKNKKANKMARQRLKKATAAFKAGDAKIFYEEISQAMWGYVGDKFNIPLSELNADNINSVLTEKGIKAEAVEAFSKTLADTEFARFAPGDKNEMMDKIHKSAIEAISKVEGSIK